MACNDSKKFKTSEASTKAWLRTKGIIDKFLNILDYNNYVKENNRLSEDAKKRFNIKGKLFYEENNKALPNKEAFKQIDTAKGIFYETKIEKDVDLSPNIKDIKPQVNYRLKATEILLSDKAKQVFEKGKKANWDLNKILTELQIPKEQKQLILNLGKTNLDEIIADLLANYSYTIEINTAKGLGDTFSLNNRYYLESFEDEISYYADIEGTEIITENVIKYRILNPNGAEVFDFENKIDAEKKLEELNSNLPNSNIYSNLTVPGGTNYTENEIATPAITPSIKGHAQFATDNGIGWFRADEQTKEGTGRIDEWDDDKNQRTVQNFVGGEPTKTRRILEVQSDLFQKGRNKENLVSGKELIEKSISIEDGFTFEGSFYKKEGNKYFKDGIEIQPNIAAVASSKAKETIQNKPSSENQFLQLLNKDNNWVTFFIKSIIQDTAKQTITEVQESDVEAKVRELENSGLLKIKCD